MFMYFSCVLILKCKSISDMYKNINLQGETRKNTGEHRKIQENMGEYKKIYELKVNM